MKKYIFAGLLTAVFFTGVGSAAAQPEASPSKTSGETRVEKLTKDSGLPFNESMELSKPLVTVFPREYSYRRCPRFDFVTKAQRAQEGERY